MSALNPVHEYLHELTIGSLTAEQDVVTVDADDDVRALVALLTEKKLTSVPVMKDGACIGHVDSLDVVSFIVGAAPSEEAIAAENEQRMEMFARVIHMQKVQHILDFSGRDPYVPLDAHQPATMAVGLFADGIHRVPVVDGEGNVCSVLSQTAVLRHLVGAADGENHLERAGLGQFSAQTLADLGLNAASDLASVTNSSTVWSALKTIKDAGVSALAVTDDAGKLVGDLSASSLRALALDAMPVLLQPISEFLAAHSPASTTPLVADGSTTFADACKQMVDAGVHRLWCVDASGAPVGVLSVTDVMRTIAHVPFTA